MLRRNRAAVSNEKNENATWPASRAFAKVILVRLLPVVRASSFKASATLVRDARKAGIVPNTKPVNNEMIRAKTNTAASIFGVTRLAETSGGRNDHKSCDPAYPIHSPTKPLRRPRETLSVRS